MQRASEDFPAAVFAKQSRYLPRPGRQAGALQNGFFAVGEAHVFTFNHSCGSLLNRRNRKNGAPMAAMRMPAGSSAGEKQHAACKV